MTKRDKIVLFNILDTIEEMQSYCEKENCTNLKSFTENTMLKRAIAMCMISISEVIINFSDEFKSENSGIDTKQFRTIRNIAAHNYGAINFSKLWDALNIDIPILQKHLEKILINQEMIIREATSIDIEAIALIISRNFDEVMANIHSKLVLDKFKAHNTHDSLLSQLRWKKVYVAVHSGEIIATGAFANFGTLETPKYSVSNLYVKPELHNKGIGRILFFKLLEEARSTQATTLHVPSSKIAIGFYSKLGFVIDIEQPDLIDEITWMAMNLNTHSLDN